MYLLTFWLIRVIIILVPNECVRSPGSPKSVGFKGRGGAAIA